MKLPNYVTEALTAIVSGATAASLETQAVDFKQNGESPKFDHPPLDTLVLAVPLAWRGKLEQCVDRLHRPSPGKRDGRVIDVDDTAHAALASMRRKREAGYRTLGYRRQRDLELF